MKCEGAFYMEKKIWNPGALLAPVPPVLVTCGTMERPNVLTVAWTGILNTKPPMTYVSIRPERYSYPLICQSGEFVINLPPASLCREVDFCGVTSGAKEDKFAAAHLTLQPSEKVACPQIAQCPVSLECRVTQKIELGSHVMFLASIQCIQVGSAFVNPQGRLMMEKMSLLAYAHGSYYELGKPLGTFGFSVRKKPKALSEEAFSNPKEAIAEKLEQHRRYKVKKKTRKMEKKGSKTIRQGNNKNSARENK